MAEVQLGQLATNRTSNPDVKAFGETMVKDHAQAGDELKEVAATLNVQVPLTTARSLNRVKRPRENLARECALLPEMRGLLPP